MDGNYLPGVHRFLDLTALMIRSIQCMQSPDFNVKSPPS